MRIPLIVLLVHLANSQLLQSRDEIEEINALKDFGERTHRRKNDPESQFKPQPQDVQVSQGSAEIPDAKHISAKKGKLSFAENPNGRKREKKKILVQKKKISSPHEINESLRTSPAAHTEEDGKELIIRLEPNRGTTKFLNTVQQQNVDRSVRKKFSKKVLVSGASPFLPKVIEGEKEPMTDIAGYTNIARRGQRQSHMEEMAHAHIRDIYVECGDAGISVQLQFNEPFHGVVYSKGYFNDPRCTYVTPGSGRSEYSFVIPTKGCGTGPSRCTPQNCGSISNVIIIQSDDVVQEVWDVARKISCTSTSSNQKTIAFKPFTVDMLEVVSVPVNTQKGTIDCWMDIQRGAYPNTSPIQEIIKIGETLTILVYLRDEKGQYDIRVRDCWAYDDEAYDAPQTTKLQLTDAEGCPRKRKLIGYWQKTAETGNSGATVIAYNNITAFKFPDKDQVYLTCNIEICTETCKNTCDGKITTYRPTTALHNCHPGSTDVNCQQTVTKPYQPVTTRPKCYPGSPDPRCPQTPTPTKQPTPQCYPGSSDPRCPQSTTRPFPQITTARPQCYPGLTDPRCPQTPRPPQTTAPQCYPGSADPRCPQTPRPTQRPETQCYPGSTDPRCPKITTTKGPTYLPPAVTPPQCYPGSSDPRCPQTTPRPLPSVTTARPQCYPGSTDPRCPQTSRPSQPPAPQCYPGSSDPRCPQTSPRPFPSVTTARPQCHPGSTDPRCPQTTPRPFPPVTTARPQCYPGSTDPRCPQTTPRPLPSVTTAHPQCYPGSTDPTCPQTPRPTQPPAPQCYPGSTDPRCPQTTPRPSVTTARPQCYPGSTDPRCPQTQRPTQPPSPQCYPGSSDPRCPQTSPRPFPSVTTARPQCYPGSSDPRCPQTPRPTQPTAPQCYPGSSDPRCPQITSRPQPSVPTTGRPQCYPGSTDPRCPQTTTTKGPTYLPPAVTPPQCYPGSSDPRCPQTTPRPLPSVTTARPQCYPGSSDPRCPQTPRPTQPTTPLCYPGSSDPRCPQTSPRPFPSVTTVRPQCYPGSTDPRCPQTPRPTQPTAPQCYPGSSDPSCRQTTLRPLPSVTTVGPQCYPGSADPRCPQTPRPTQTPSPQCYPGSTDPTCSQTSKPTHSVAPQCYPGSTDPRCPNKCYPGSIDPDCPSPPITQGPEYLPPLPAQKPGNVVGCRPGSSSGCAGDESGLNVVGVKPDCFPGSPDPRCSASGVRNEIVSGSKQSGKSHDGDPRYHSFHSWLYDQPKSTQRRPHTGQRVNYGRRKRSIYSSDGVSEAMNQNNSDFPDSLLSGVKTQKESILILSGVVISMVVIFTILYRTKISSEKKLPFFVERSCTNV